MSKKILAIVGIIILFFVAGAAVYVTLRQGFTRITKEEPELPTKQSFAFRVILPKDSPFQYGELEAVTPGETIPISKGGGFNLKESPFVSAGSKQSPTTTIFIHKKENGDILQLSLFSRAFAEKNLDKQGLQELEPYLWPAKNAIIIDTRSTAVSLTTMAIRLLSIPGSEGGEIVTLKWLAQAMDNPKLSKLGKEVEGLIKEGKSYTDEQSLYSLAATIANEASQVRPEGRGVSEEQLFDCGRDKKCYYSHLEKCLPAKASFNIGGTNEIGEFKIFGFNKKGQCLLETKNLTYGAGMSCKLPKNLAPFAEELLSKEEILSRYCQPFYF